MAATHELSFMDSYKIDTDTENATNLLICDGFTFHAGQTMKISTYFNCSREFKGCPAKTTLYNYDKDKNTYLSYKVYLKDLHNHLPNPEKIQKMRSIQHRSEKQANQYRNLDDRLGEIINGYNPTMSTISTCMYGYQDK